MNDDIILKPCPFCGSDDVDPTFWLAEKDGVESSGPGCMNCGATAESIGGWNMRSASTRNAETK